MLEFLNKPIGGKSTKAEKSIKIGKGKYPDKKTINLLVMDTGSEDPKKRILIMILVAVLAAAFLKFLVFDRIWQGVETEREYTELKTQIAELKTVTKDYEKVRMDYGHYGNGYANEEEAAEQDRAVIMSVINADVLAKADIQSVQIAENQAVVSIDNIKLGTISSIVADLEGEDTVSYVNVSTAGTNTSENGSVQATININFKGNGGNK